MMVMKAAGPVALKPTGKKTAPSFSTSRGPALKSPLQLALLGKLLLALELLPLQQKKRPTCWTCGSHTHFEKNCPHCTDSSGGGYLGRGQKKHDGNESCWTCGSQTHRQKNCPEFQHQQRTSTKKPAAAGSARKAASGTRVASAAAKKTADLLDLWVAHPF
mmetsp:Transcript_7797/g.13023  ORF Transcript_7797/g.13023 Transcript_7797/m.13023 type:complete len:161 (+) Transcript_7797:1-483(+)